MQRKLYLEDTSIEKKRKKYLRINGIAAGLATSSSNRSSAGGNSGSNHQEEEDVDLVVDGDDAAEFGPAQYSEADVVAPRMDGTPREQKERDALREAVISPNAPNTPHTPHTPEQIGQGLVEVKPEPGTTTPLGQSEQDEGVSTSPRRDGDTPVIEALRGRIRELEAEMRGQPFKCLICMVSFFFSFFSLQNFEREKRFSFRNSYSIEAYSLVVER